MNILITGAAGFVGSNICKKLLQHGHTIFAVDNLKFGKQINILELQKEYPDRCIFSAVGFEETYISKVVDAVIHAATDNIIYAMENRSEVISNNAAHAIYFFNRIERDIPIIYLSTASVYGNASEIPTSENATLRPTEIYSETKLLAEDFLAMRGNYTILRLSNVYGPNQWPEGNYSGVISKILHSALKHEPILIYGSGAQTRDFTYVEDVADACMLTLMKGPMNTEINIATGIETSIIWIVNHSRIFGNMSLPPSRYTYIGERRIDNITRRCLDISKARKLLVWEPKINMESGLMKTVTWLKENHTYEKAN